MNRRFARRPVFDTYSRGRKDARVGEARAFLGGAQHLRNLTADGLRCQFNLKPATAERLLADEQGRRGDG